MDSLCFSGVNLTIPLNGLHTVSQGLSLMSNVKRQAIPMWFETLPKGKSWAALWTGYIRCGRCSGIRRTSGLCPGCATPMPVFEPVKMKIINGIEFEVPMAFAGAEGRYEDWVYLIMLEREWLRPLTDDDRFLNVAETSRPSARAVVVLIFWTYFETRIDRLFREALKHLPDTVTEDLLRRYASIGARLDRLYKVVFSTTYSADLKDLGFSTVSRLLVRVQQQRNKFAHGHPEAIDDGLVLDLVTGLRDEHESWIAVFNRRATKQLLP